MARMGWKSREFVADSWKNWPFSEDFDSIILFQTLKRWKVTLKKIKSYSMALVFFALIVSYLLALY